jgi:hypothetical protein
VATAPVATPTLTDAAAGSNRRPVPNAGQQRVVTPIADETH